MDQGKFAQFVHWVQEAFVDVSRDLTDLEFAVTEQAPSSQETMVAAVIGMVGRNPGRIIFTLERRFAQVITNRMNGEPLDDEMELYLYFAEFANMVAGNATTPINNHYQGGEIRLTPPAIFVGNELEVTTPNITSALRYFSCGHGIVTVDIGFEGV